MSFEVRAGEFLALLGPNGAGKSTTIALATGLLKVGQGQVLVFGHPAGSFPARQSFAYVPQEPSFPAHVTARQVLRFMGAHFPGSRAPEELARQLELEGFLDTSVRYLSGGQKRLLSIASAFVSNARFVILDEPTVGLDMEVRRKVWEFLSLFTRGGGTILMTTHYLVEAEELADRVVVLAGGKVVQSGSPQEIKKQFGFKRISFRSNEAPPPHLQAQAKTEKSEWLVDSRSPDQALRELVQWGRAEDIEVTPLALEDVFLRLIEGAH
ncbi:MAG: ABC transporter ATP-binding protein [Bdellovibrionaceae bacterium]|nr:ABC transporter ATP-binding protein [Pseudobdellovibrionaceae bacterium]